MAYYPYGEERTSTVDGRDKFGTYFRDGLGQDYADQRLYNASAGRFWTVDPGGIGTANLGYPTSWNRYGYTQGDPMNGHDPSGLVTTKTGSGGCTDPTDPTCELPCDPAYWLGFDDSAFGCDAGGGGGGGGCYASGNGLLGQPDPGCPDGGGGGGGGSGPGCPSGQTATLGKLSGMTYCNIHSTGADWNAFAKTLKKVAKAVQSDPACMKFLSGTQGQDRVKYELKNITEFYSLASSIMDGDYIAGTTFDASGAPIVINEENYDKVGASEDVLAILHEFAHLVGAIPNDGLSVTQSNVNDSNIKSNCAKALGGIK